MAKHDSLAYLTYDHRVVGRISDIGSESDLRWHMLNEHGHLTRRLSKKELALMHMLTHAELGALKRKDT
jgi:hypothetical protein